MDFNQTIFCHGMIIIKKQYIILGFDCHSLVRIELELYSMYSDLCIALIYVKKFHN